MWYKYCGKVFVPLLKDKDLQCKNLLVYEFVANPFKTGRLTCVVNGSRSRCLIYIVVMLKWLRV